VVEPAPALPPKTPRRQRGKRTRAALVEAAQKVFERDGYLDARVADIAAAAGVAHGSFYTYFDSKEDVFRELVEVALMEVSEAIDVREGSPVPAERIQAGNRRYMDVYARHAALLGLIEQVGTLTQFHAMRRELRARFVTRIEGVIGEYRESGHVDIEPLDARAVAHALVGMMDSFAYNWFVLSESFDREVALSNLDAIWLRTLGLEEPHPAAPPPPAPPPPEPAKPKSAKPKSAKPASSEPRTPKTKASNAGAPKAAAPRRRSS
jgi:AcrR family transcriptional regulator